MVADLQKASLWKRMAAWLLDMILIAVLAVGAAAGLSAALGYDAAEARLEEKYVDDCRFAGAYVRDKARFSKWGKVKIAYNLKMLGVGKEIVSRVLEENADLFSDELLEQLVVKKWNSLGEKVAPAAKREKVLRFALGRGFGYDQILPVIKRLG